MSRTRIHFEFATMRTVAHAVEIDSLSLSLSYSCAEQMMDKSEKPFVLCCACQNNRDFRPNVLISLEGKVTVRETTPVNRHRVDLSQRDVYSETRVMHRNTNMMMQQFVAITTSTLDSWQPRCFPPPSVIFSFFIASEHYLRKLAPGSDINCCIAFTRIQT